MSEDPAQDIEQKYDTKPTLDTVLQYLAEFRSEVNTRIEGLQAEIIGTRGEMGAGFRKLGHKIDALNNHILELRADMRDPVSRMDAIEVRR